jgi:DNA-binding transcriptional regulator YdaS (Cro superfamily)
LVRDNRHRKNTGQDATIAFVVKKAGGMRALGRALGISHQAILSWTHIPAERVVAIEEATGIPREKLRPDLYKRRGARP